MWRINYLSLALVIVFSTAAGLSGCNPIKSAQKNERITQLKVITNTYRKLMRWGHFDQASQYLKARDGTVQQPDLKIMSRYQVTGFKVADELIADTNTDARVTAYVEFYNVETGVTNSVRDDQYWWYDEEAKRWYLGSPMVSFSAYDK